MSAGIGAEVAALLSERAFEWFDAPLVRVAAPGTPVPRSPALEAAFIPGVARTVQAARRLAAY